jgi:hypothetical protein
MSYPYAGVIEISTGDLLRCGYCDFEHDGQLKPDTESVRYDTPNPGKIKGSPFYIKNFHRWTGTEWILINKE